MTLGDCTGPGTVEAMTEGGAVTKLVAAGWVDTGTAMEEGLAMTVETRAGVEAAGVAAAADGVEASDATEDPGVAATEEAPGVLAAEAEATEPVATRDDIGTEAGMIEDPERCCED